MQAQAGYQLTAEQASMSELLQKTVICQDSGDGSGDLVIEIPQHVLESMKVAPGDSLHMDIVDSVLMLSAIHGLDTKT